VFLVEQNARVALDVADRFYLMEQGRVSFQGTPGELAQDEVIRRAYLGSARPRLPSPPPQAGAG
jgi:branched-chain amino acid transport system ATP-binding protein